jgi:hypothetical protein
MLLHSDELENPFSQNSPQNLSRWQCLGNSLGQASVENTVCSLQVKQELPHFIRFQFLNGSHLVQFYEPETVAPECVYQ